MFHESFVSKISFTLSKIFILILINQEGRMSDCPTVSDAYICAYMYTYIYDIYIYVLTHLYVQFVIMGI